MTGRGGLAAAILLVWASTLIWHVKREYFRPFEALLAEAAATLPPGVAYYAIYSGEERTGWAQSRVDTLPGRAGFLVEDRMEGRLAGLGGAGRISLETSVRLGPTLALESFRLESRGPLGPVTARGTVEADSLLRMVVARGDEPPDSIRVRLDGPVVPATTLAMRLAAEESLEAGDRVRIPVFDPVSLSRRIAEVEVLAVETRSFPDSADTDVAGRWRVAGRDTVRAWLVERQVAGLTLRSWVDEDGRLVEADLGGGLRLERTAFELAYYPYRDRRR